LSQENIEDETEVPNIHPMHYILITDEQNLKILEEILVEVLFQNFSL